MNSTRLKTTLLLQGINVTKRAKSALPVGKNGALAHQDYPTTGGLVLMVNDQFFVNARVCHNEVDIILDLRDDAFCLLSRYHSMLVSSSVRILPAAYFALHNTLLSDGTPVRSIVGVHADRVRLSPIKGCAFHCSFCPNPQSNYRLVSGNLLEEALSIAISDPLTRFRHALISGGTPRELREDYIYLNEIYSSFPRKYSDIEFDVMLSPRGLNPKSHNRESYREFLSFLFECGIANIAINLEIFSSVSRKQLIPEKENVGIDRYRIFFEEAMKLFGADRLRSGLVIGLEPIDDSLSGVKFIVNAGINPMLSLYQPSMNSLSAEKVDIEILLGVIEQSYKIAISHGLTLGPKCRPCTHNTLTYEE